MRVTRQIYWSLVLKARAARLIVTACSVAATLTATILPAEHRHESSTGQPIVHRHVIAYGAEHAGAIDHGDHRGVGTLEATFVSERHYEVQPPLSAVAF